MIEVHTKITHIIAATMYIQCACMCICNLATHCFIRTCTVVTYIYCILPPTGDI